MRPVATAYPAETPARSVSSSSGAARSAAVPVQLRGVEMVGRSGVVDVPPMALCDAARVVLGDTVQADYSCTGGGVVSVVSSSPDPASLFGLFVRTVERIGGTVRPGPMGSAVVVGPADGGAATGAVGQDLGAALDLGGLDEFIVDGASPEQFQAVMNVTRYGAQGLVRPLRDDIDVTNARELAAELGLDLRVVELGGASFVVGDEVSLSTFDAFSGLSERVVVPFSASGVTPAALASFQSAYPAVQMTQDDASGTVYVAGLPQDVAVAVSALRQVQPQVSRVRIEGLFVTYETGQLNRLESDLRIAAPVGVGGDLLGVSNGATLGLPFELVVQHVQSADFVQVVARPALTATFGLPAEFRSGGEVPVIGGRDTETGQETVEYRSVGLTTRFTATPLQGELVRLAIDIEVSSVSGSGVLSSPSFDVRSVSTVVDLRRGDTVLLSGLSEMARSSSRGRSFGLPSSAGSASDKSLGLFVTLR